MKRQIFVSETPLESRIAIKEDGQLVEFYIETPDEMSSVGNIYYGKIDSIQPGIHAAFVDNGEEVNGFLGFPEIKNVITYGVDGWKTQSFKDHKSIKMNQSLLVQVVKDAYGTKGPRLTTDIAIPGRFVVLTPFQKHVGISKKISSRKKRDQLRKLAQSIKPEGFGMIVRTVAENQPVETISNDMKQVMSIWNDIEDKVKQSRLKTPLVYENSDITTKIVRDLFTKDVDKMVVDNRKSFRNIQTYIKEIAPDLINKVSFHKEGSLFQTYNITKETDKLLRRKVWLKSGGHIVIDHTEALYAIDVNSGRFIGGKEQEANILKVNLEACKEIARQLRLRDISGLIVIDYIDMRYAENRKKLVSTFKAELSKDRASVSVADLSPYGLLEMTRERVRMSVMFSLSDECPMCHGYGRIPSKESMVSKIDMWMRRFKQFSNEKRLELYVHPLLFDFLKKEKKILRRAQFKYHLRVELQTDEKMGVGGFKFVSYKTKDDLTGLY